MRASCDRLMFGQDIIYRTTIWYFPIFRFCLIFLSWKGLIKMSQDRGGEIEVIMWGKTITFIRILFLFCSIYPFVLGFNLLLTI